MSDQANEISDVAPSSLSHIIGKESVADRDDRAQQ
jgi:hypothetical protein